jgi:hypothetical protein
MKFWYINYQHKGAPYRDALLSAGFELSQDSPDFLLIDRERYMTNNSVPRSEVARYPGVPVITYPHCALPPWWYDGLVPAPDYIKCVFVIGEGQKRAMKIIAPHVKVESAGWAWSELLPFNPPTQIRNILFAPIHPTGGRLRPEAFEANQAIMRELIDLSMRDGSYNVTIRYVGSRVRQGVRRYADFRYTRGGANGVTDEIDRADVVIAEGTMLYLTVARGKPAIGINQHLPMRPNMREGYTPHNWHKYGDDIAYPINYGTAPIRDLFDRAMTEQAQWRRDFIGDAFCPHRFAGIVEGIVKNKVKL